jgi:hypothetical protein
MPNQVSFKASSEALIRVIVEFSAKAAALGSGCITA